MPHHHTITVAGRITHVFGHRFVVQTDRDAVLADLTPKGLEQIALQVGDIVELTGEEKPSELKVTRVAVCSRSTTARCRPPSSCPWAPTAPSRA